MTDPEEARRARVALAWLVEPGNAAMYDLVARYGPVEAMDRLVTGHADGQLTGAAAARLRHRDPGDIADAALDRADRLGARIVTPEDGEWPVWVEDLVRLAANATGREDRDVLPPLCLWTRGGLPLAGALRRSVAVVGARASTEYGDHLAIDLAYGLAERGWTVVSGGAYGIDAAAHRGALAGAGPTVAVLACGVDRAYPAQNAAVFERIAETGLLVSEWPPGAQPYRHRFLVRNRVIAALTRGTVVVEAAARSGALQTLRRAAGIGRRPMVMPGSVMSAMSVGCHEALRDIPEARLVTGLNHVLEEVGLVGTDLAPPTRGPERDRDRLDPPAARVLDGVPGRGEAGPDQIAAAAGVDIRTALRQLPLLERLGCVVRRESGYALPPPRRAGGHPARGAAGGAPA